MANKWQYQEWYAMGMYNAGKRVVKSTDYYDESTIREWKDYYKPCTVDSRLARGLIHIQYGKDFLREMYLHEKKERKQRMEKYFENILYYYSQLTMTRVIKENCRIVCNNALDYLHFCEPIKSDSIEELVKTISGRIKKHDQWMAKEFAKWKEENKNV